jgi:hypothetical protein
MPLGLPSEKRHAPCLKHALGSHLVMMMYVDTTDRQAAEAVQSALMSIF